MSVHVARPCEDHGSGCLICWGLRRKVARMSSDHSGSPEEELIDSMMLAIDENESTREIGSQGTCIHGSESYVVGPWDRQLCARVLSAWARAGWVGLFDLDYGRNGRRNMPPAQVFRLDEPDTLLPDTAEQILADPSTWTAGTWIGELRLFETAVASSDDDVYRGVARAAMDANPP